MLFGHNKLGHLPKRDLPKHRKLRLFLLTLLMGLVLLIIAATVLRPRAAEQLAEILPVAWLKAASEQVQDHLDSSQLRPSQAPTERIENLTARFASLAAPATGASPYRLSFRRGTRETVLTYALPDGSIVVTDELLAQIPDDAEILALLCHELGHLHYRHMLRSTIENQVYFLGVATLLGLENQAVPRLAQGFLNSEMNADANTEADRFALAMLEENGIPRQSLNAALSRLAVLTLTNAAQPQILHAPSREQFQTRLQMLNQPTR